MFTEAFLTTGKTEKPPKCPSMDERIEKTYICNGILRSHKKERNLAMCDTTDGPCEIGQTEKEKYHMISLLFFLHEEILQHFPFLLSFFSFSSFLSFFPLSFLLSYKFLYTPHFR